MGCRGPEVAAGQLEVMMRELRDIYRGFLVDATIGLAEADLTNLLDEFGRCVEHIKYIITLKTSFFP